MRHLFRINTLAAISLTAAIACNGPIDEPASRMDDTMSTVAVNLGAKLNDESTKSVLTPDEYESYFSFRWSEGDMLGLDYEFISGDNTSGNWNVQATWKEESEFTATLPNVESGDWSYHAAYPFTENGVIDMGTIRTQVGNTMNGRYDIMVADEVQCENSATGLYPDGTPVTFTMHRQTGIVFFHLTGQLDEEVTRAVLTAGDATISAGRAVLSSDEFSYSDGHDWIDLSLTDAGSKDLMLWFNVLPTTYSDLTLTVETTGHVLTISNLREGEFKAGKLYKTVLDVSTKWTPKHTLSIPFDDEAKVYVEGKTVSDGVKIAAGRQVTLEPCPNLEETFVQWDVFSTGNDDPITVTDNSFIMPDEDVTIRGQYEVNPEYQTASIQGGSDLIPAYGATLGVDVDSRLTGWTAISSDPDNFKIANVSDHSFNIVISANTQTVPRSAYISIMNEGRLIFESELVQAGLEEGTFTLRFGGDTFIKEREITSDLYDSNVLNWNCLQYVLEKPFLVSGFAYYGYGDHIRIGKSGNYKASLYIGLKDVIRPLSLTVRCKYYAGPIEDGNWMASLSAYGKVRHNITKWDFEDITFDMEDMDEYYDYIQLDAHRSVEVESITVSYIKSAAASSN